MTDAEFNDLINRAGKEWNQTKGDMTAYLRIVVNLAREFERSKIRVGVIPWTSAEIKEFIRIYPTTPIQVLMKKYNRSRGAIMTKASSLRLFKDEEFKSKQCKKAADLSIQPRKRKSSLTIETATAILKEYPYKSNAELAEKYGTNRHVISRLAIKNKVSKSSEFTHQAAVNCGKQCFKNYDVS